MQLQFVLFVEVVDLVEHEFKRARRALDAIEIGTAEAGDPALARPGGSVMGVVDLPSAISHGLAVGRFVRTLGHQRPPIRRALEPVA